MSDRSEQPAGLPRHSTAPEASALHLPRISPAPATILEYLIIRFPHIDAGQWRRRIEEGKVVQSDGAAIGEGTPYAPDTTIHYFRETQGEESIPFREEIIYRDDHLLIADKPHFLPVVPAGPYVNECLLFRLRRSTGLENLIPAHRLDRETAGLVLFALDPSTRACYHRLFAEGNITKEYLAVGEGTGALEERFTIRGGVVPGEPWFRMRWDAGTQNSVTHISVLGGEGNRIRFHLRPETGKKHQLRVHLLSAGYPIVNDGLYPDVREFAPYDYGRPLQLLAHRLSFTDPVSGRAMEFISRRELLL